ncbi:uncharacterized protein [Physcomitrium patens]|uniref:uncharacterized protein isoform X3 n=1 Tax=Physcomitrium patens TaxID=3218 RepID=UPI003CCD6B4C
MAKEGGVSLGLRVSVKRFCEIYPGGVSHYGVYREESTLWFSYCTTFKSMKAMLGEDIINVAVWFSRSCMDMQLVSGLGVQRKKRVTACVCRSWGSRSCRKPCSG